jgi:transposase-like protein
MAESSDFVGVDYVARKFGVGKDTVRKWIRRGQLKAGFPPPPDGVDIDDYVPTQFFIHRADLNNFLIYRTAA